MFVFSPIKLTHNLVGTIIYYIIIVQGHVIVWPQVVLGYLLMCLGTVMYVHDHVWAQSCMCMIMSGHKI